MTTRKFYKGVMESVKEYGGNLYFLSHKNKKYGLWEYNEKKGKYTCLIDLDQIEKMDVWPAKAQEKGIDMVSIGIWGDKIYFNVYLHFYVKELAESGPKKGKNVKCFYDRPVLLSADLSDLHSWKLEEPLMDYLQERDQQMCIVDEEGSYYYCAEDNARIEEIYGGEVLISYWDGKGSDFYNNSVIAYNMVTEEVQELEDTDYRFWRADHVG